MKYSFSTTLRIFFFQPGHIANLIPYNLPSFTTALTSMGFQNFMTKGVTKVCVCLSAHVLKVFFCYFH